MNILTRLLKILRNPRMHVFYATVYAALSIFLTATAYAYSSYSSAASASLVVLCVGGLAVCVKQFIFHIRSL